MCLMINDKTFIKNVYLLARTVIKTYETKSKKEMERKIMKENAIQRIKEVGKISRVITIIAKILVIVGIVITLVGAVMCFALPKDAVKVNVAGVADMDINYEALGVSEQEFMEEMDQQSGLDVKTTDVQFGGTDSPFSLRISEQDYKPVDVVYENGSVKAKMESDGTEITLRDIGGMLLVASVALVMMLVILSFVEALCKAFRDCSTPFEEKVIKKMQNLAISLIPWGIISPVITSALESFMQGGLHLNFTIDMGLMLIVLIVFLLVHIFKYGAILQQESDETL